MAHYTDADKQTIRREPLASLIPHPRNARQGDVGAIAVSLEAHGQYRPIVCQTTTRHVIAGNHTMRAALSLGWTHINTVWLDVDDDEALRIMLVDNRTNDLATYDDVELGDLLSELAATADGLDGSGYSGDDLNTLLRQIRGYEKGVVEPSAIWGDLLDYDSDDSGGIAITIRVATEADWDALLELLGQTPGVRAKSARQFWWPSHPEDSKGSRYDLRYVSDT